MNVVGRQSAVRVVDLGGYHGHHHAVAARSLPRTTFDWTVVELPDVVQSCADITTSGLHFTTDLRAALQSGADICVASASLNYIADPMGALTAMVRAASAVVLLRLPLWPIAEHRPAIQRLSRHSAQAGYPTWFFSETQFRDQVGTLGRIILSFDVPEDRAYFAGHYGCYQGLVIASGVSGA
jgi:putative methyltransferase (TIGR04325 family)